MIIEKPSRTYAWFHDVTTQDIEVNRGEGVGAHKVLAGSPIDENGNIANDETAIGLLMETVSDANPDGKIIVAGDVDALGAKNASGIELSDAAKNALSGITWREPDYVVEMPTGGGGGAMVVHFSTDGISITADKTPQEVYEAMFTMPVIGVFSVIVEGEATMQMPVGCAMLHPVRTTPAFNLLSYDADTGLHFGIIVDDDAWALSN